jgi:hypothetical protein
MPGKTLILEILLLERVRVGLFLTKNAIAPNQYFLSEPVIEFFNTIGHDEPFPPERVSGRRQICQGTSGGAYSGGLAPKAVLVRLK